MVYCLKLFDENAAYHLALGALVSNNTTKAISPVNAASQGLKPTDVAIYWGMAGGYCNINNTLKDIGHEFPDITPFSATKYGAVFLTNTDQVDRIINYKIDNPNSIKFEVPFLLPCTSCETPDFEFLLRLARYVQHGDDGEFAFTEDVWDYEATIRINGSGQFNIKDQLLQ